LLKLFSDVVRLSFPQIFATRQLKTTSVLVVLAVLVVLLAVVSQTTSVLVVWF
jgi:hypothetical protein